MRRLLRQPMRQRSPIAILTLAALLAWVATSTADDPAPAGGPRLDLLDRGGLAAAKPGLGPETHTGLPTATLANLAGTPGATMAMGFGGAPALGALGFPVGYFFPPAPAPGGFPTSYLPFFVTGAYGFIGSPGGLGLMTIVVPPVVAAGVAPGPFTVATGTWLGFVTAMPPLAPVPGPSALVGAKATFPHSLGLSVPTAPPGLGVACGVDGFIVGGVGPTAVLGGVTSIGFPAGTGGGKPLSGLMPPGPASGLASVLALPATYIVGCFITGATVPVELQSFHVD